MVAFACVLGCVDRGTSVCSEHVLTHKHNLSRQHPRTSTPDCKDLTTEEEACSWACSWAQASGLGRQRSISNHVSSSTFRVTSRRRSGQSAVELPFLASGTSLWRQTRRQATTPISPIARGSCVPARVVSLASRECHFEAAQISWAINMRRLCSVQFTRFSTELGYDFFSITNGSSVGGAALFNKSGVLDSSSMGPFVFVASCLRMTFLADRSVTSSGVALSYTSLELGKCANCKLRMPLGVHQPIASFDVRVDVQWSTAYSSSGVRNQMGTLTSTRQ